MSEYTYTSTSVTSTIPSSEQSTTPTRSQLQEKIPLHLTHLANKVDETLKAESKYHEWCHHAMIHVYKLEVKQQCIFEYEPWRAIDEEIQMFGLWKHDMLFAVLGLQQHVKALHMRLEEMYEILKEEQEKKEEEEDEEDEEDEPWYKPRYDSPVQQDVMVNVLEYLKARDVVSYDEVEEDEDDMCSFFEISEEEWLQDMAPVMDWVDKLEVGWLA
ncbi:MAG: DHS-like NAD/FAD-binding domain-containing protein [Aureobasidium pullulans]|nr:MAG: DHS-like NAD/FAD-binding domain-containing protein [Aureobasidium pullulans]